MAPITMECMRPTCVAGVDGAKYKTPPLEPGDAVLMLDIHDRQVHGAAEAQVHHRGGRGGAAAKPNKMATPKLEMGTGPDDFALWIEKWQVYKRTTGITELQDIRDQLTICCSEELYRDLHRSLGSSLQTKTEAELIKEMKKLAVPHHSNLVNIVNLRSITQERDERIRSYVARIRGQASICELTVPCTRVGCDERVSYADHEILNTLVKGLYDTETKEEVLSKEPQMDLNATILFIEARESGKRSAGVLAGEAIASNQINRTAVAAEGVAKNVIEADDKTRCKYCGRSGHGKSPDTDIRRSKCPAWDQECQSCKKKGHFKKVCKTKTPASAQVITMNRMSTNENKGKEKFKTRVVKVRNMKPLSHEVFDKEAAVYKEQLPLKDPMVRVNIQVDIQAYLDHKPELQCNLMKEFCVYSKEKSKWIKDDSKLPLSLELIADTGAQVTVLGDKYIGEIGMRPDLLLPTTVSLNCANQTEAGVLGMFLAKISGKSVVSGEEITAHSQVFVVRGKCCLLSRSILSELGCLPEKFPEIGRFPKSKAIDQPAGGNSGIILSSVSSNSGGDQPVRQPAGECDPDSPLPCSCPRREFTDPPDALPMPATASNRKALEDYIKDRYKASAFNACKRQSWPKTEGPPMKIFTKPGTTPLCIRKPAQVPLHWRKQVQDDIKADVARGVLEKVPYGTPDTWCTRMVITAKKNGTPRRTIDLSALSKACIRETHHTRSPAKVARTVPANKLKSTLDCVDGYHGVEIAEEDRHKTTFITEDGKYRYKRIPQGYGSSGDGYTRRTDEILATCPDTPESQDYEKIIDDVIIWNNNLESAFYRVCNILSHCNKSGMMFSRKKFNFAKEEVEFAGITISKEGIKPTDDYLETIANFPTPTNIHDIRSWFGLINQISYCFAASTIMAPFRHLLSPKNEFKWDEDMEEAFVASKKEIVRLIKEGVDAFDPELTTCLSPDYSNTGMGWILQQKTCKCTPVSPICCKTGWRLVLAGGRFCNSAETRYSVTEGEALACAEGLKDTKYYTLGCKDLYIATDHQPLLGLLGDRNLDSIENPRLVRIKEKTFWWDFKMLHVPGVRQEAADAISRRQSPKALYSVSVSLLADEGLMDMAEAYREEVTVNINSVNSAQNLSVVTWDRIFKCTQEDGALVKLIEQIERGFPDSQHDVPKDIREYHEFRNNLHVVDGVVCYKGRLVVPSILRHEIMAAIHAAHQGVSGMNNRVAQSVFWPGITNEIINARHTCKTCIREAPSQPAGLPVPPPSPEYPFQLIVCDYFSLQGHNYLVLGDRYSGWLSIHWAGDGEFDGRAMERVFRQYFMTFNIPEEVSSDGGPQMMSETVQNCFRRWGIHHRLSSSYFPHSNCRAELAVKTGKRLLRDNMNIQGTLDSDKVMRACMMYRNTPIPELRMSPAQIVFGRHLRDFIPVLPYKYRPSQEWALLREDRERALASRREGDGTRLARYTKDHPDLPVGTSVAVQNQTGRNKTKWDKTGVILENKPHKQVLVRMDGSRRMTLRNRKFIKHIIPPVMTKPPKNQQQEPQIEATHRPVEQNPSLLHRQPLPPLAQHLGDYSGQLEEQLPGGITEIIPSPDESPPATVSQPTPSPPPPMAPSPSPPPSSVPVSMRPKRERKPNSLYSPEVYDLNKVDMERGEDDLGLSGLVDDSATLSRKQVIQMFKYIMDMLPEDQ